MSLDYSCTLRIWKNKNEKMGTVCRQMCWALGPNFMSYQRQRNCNDFSMSYQPNLAAANLEK